MLVASRLMAFPPVRAAVAELNRIPGGCRAGQPVLNRVPVLCASGRIRFGPEESMPRMAERLALGLYSATSTCERILGYDDLASMTWVR